MFSAATSHASALVSLHVLVSASSPKLYPCWLPPCIAVLHFGGRSGPASEKCVRLRHEPCACGAMQLLKRDVQLHGDRRGTGGITNGTTLEQVIMYLLRKHGARHLRKVGSHGRHGVIAAGFRCFCLLQSTGSPSNTQRRALRSAGGSHLTSKPIAPPVVARSAKLCKAVTTERGPRKQGTKHNSYQPESLHDAGAL